MQILSPPNDYQEAIKKLYGKVPDPSNAPITVDSDTAVIADGAITAVFLHDVIPAHLHKLAYQCWKHVGESLTNRPAAVGVQSIPRTECRDGHFNRRVGVHVEVEEKVLDEEGVTQGVLGWDAKNHGLTRLTRKHREMLDGNKPLIKLVNSIYKKYAPSVYAVQRSAIKSNTDSDCRLWHTAFSNIYVLNQWAIPYHKDKNNLHGVLTALICCGEFTGAELMLPRWRLKIPYQPGDLVLFDPQQLHGVLPFTGARLSAAFYCSGKIAA